MRKIITTILCLASMSLFITGCGSEEKETVTNKSSDKSRTAESSSISSSSSEELIDFTTYSTNLSIKDFSKNPETMQDQKTIFVAKVFQVMDAENLVQYMATVTPSANETVTVALVINKDKLSEKIIENDEIRVWVRGLNVYDYTTTTGVKNTVPRFLIDGYDIV